MGLGEAVLRRSGGSSQKPRDPEGLLRFSEMLPTPTREDIWARNPGGPADRGLEQEAWTGCGCRALTPPPPPQAALNLPPSSTTLPRGPQPSLHTQGPLLTPSPGSLILSCLQSELHPVQPQGPHLPRADRPTNPEFTRTQHKFGGSLDPAAPLSVTRRPEPSCPQ